MCRIQADLTLCFKVTSKGILDKVINGELHNKIKGPFVIQLRFDSRSLHIVATKSAMIELVIAEMIAAPLEVFIFE